MDRVGWVTLRAEVMDDIRVATAATALARLRFTAGDASGLESCAYQLVRVFNIIEQMGLRVAKAFENHIDDERGWHSQLLHRLGIEVPGVRPAFYRPEILLALRGLRGFRHVVHHAYDLDLDAERVAMIVRHAEDATRLLPEMADRFFQTVHSDLFDP